MSAIEPDASVGPLRHIAASRPHLGYRGPLRLGREQQILGGMPLTLTEDQRNDVLALCEQFPSRTGMYVRPMSWATIDAFLAGYVASWPGGASRALHLFATEGLEPSSLIWTSRLHQRHDPGVGWAEPIEREHGERVANLLCAVIRDFADSVGKRH
ncbi:hypothetical protein GCM10028777_13100 [Angustibacter speluncae]